MKGGALFSLTFAFATQASAATSPSLELSGSGCSGREESHSFSGADAYGTPRHLEVRFSSFTASRGPGHSLIDSRSDCTLELNLPVAPGTRVALSHIELRGPATLPRLTLARVGTQLSSPATSYSGGLAYPFHGPWNQEWSTSLWNDANYWHWSRCGNGEGLKLHLFIHLTGNTEEDSSVSVRSLNLEFARRGCP